MCRYLRIRIHELSIFFGPRILELHIFETSMRIGCIPTGSYVKYDVEDYRSRPLIQRLAVVLSLPVVLVCFSVVILGSARAFHHIGTGLWQLPMGALHPVSIGQSLIAKAHEAYSTSLVVWVGIASSKIAAGSLIPLGRTCPVHMVEELFQLYSETGIYSRILTLTAVLTIGMTVSWAFACVIYMR